MQGKIWINKIKQILIWDKGLEYGHSSSPFLFVLLMDDIIWNSKNKSLAFNIYGEFVLHMFVGKLDIKIRNKKVKNTAAELKFLRTIVSNTSTRMDTERIKKIWVSLITELLVTDFRSTLTNVVWHVSIMSWNEYRKKFCK